MDIFTLIQTGFEAFIHSYFFGALKIFLGIYSFVLFIDILLILSLRNKTEMLKEGNVLFQNIHLSILRSSLKKRWLKIESRLQSGNISEYKVAILEADNSVDEALTDSGYKGTDMTQKIEQLRLVHVEDAIALDEVHQIRNRIVFEQDFHLDLDQTKKILETYRTYLKKLDYLE
jgi:hypothetical protein